MESQRVGHDLGTEHTHINFLLFLLHSGSTSSELNLPRQNQGIS